MINNDINSQQQEEFQQLEAAVKLRLTKEAVTRLSNIKSAHQERYFQLLVMLGQMLQGKESMIDDDKLKEILQQTAPAKKEFRIRTV